MKSLETPKETSVYGRESADSLAELWVRYKAEGGQDLSDRLIVHYKPLIDYAARKLGAGLARTVELDDLVSYGTFGLIDAIAKFDPARGIKFQSYAVTRIRGAIIDELRANDWAPRSIRAKGRAVEQAQAKLEAKLSRSPNAAEVAAEMAIPVAELQAVLGEISAAGPVAALDDMLSSASGESRDSVTLGDTVPDRRAGPTAALDLDQMARTLAGAINRLDERYRQVLALYFVENLTFNEIGTVLGVTESRVCQIHTKAVIQLATSCGALALTG